MVQVIRSPQFTRDLVAIWLHIAARSPTAADRVVSAIDDIVESKSLFPLSGTLCEHLAAGLRKARWREFQIFYRMNGDVMELVRVVHGRRKITAAMFT